MLELLKLELFDLQNAYLQNVLINHIFNMYVKTGFGIK